MRRDPSSRLSKWDQIALGVKERLDPAQPVLETWAGAVLIFAPGGAGGRALTTLRIGRGVTTLPPSAIWFSQSSVTGVGAIVQSMRANGWVGAPIDVVAIHGRLITVDNTRLIAAHLAGIPVRAVIRGANEALPASMAGRFVPRQGLEAMTWGQAVLVRIGNQSAAYRNANPFGSWFVGVTP